MPFTIVPATLFAWFAGQEYPAIYLADRPLASGQSNHPLPMHGMELHKSRSGDNLSQNRFIQRRTISGD
jgi:hypothetical protein